MILEFYTKHRKLLILMCILAVYGIFNLIQNIIMIFLIIFDCKFHPDSIDILCQIFYHV